MPRCLVSLIYGWSSNFTGHADRGDSVLDPQAVTPQTIRNDQPLGLGEE